MWKGASRLSYSILRIAKIKASGVTGIQIHDRREKNISHTNKDIDWTKTEENISLMEQQERFRTVVTNKIATLNLKRQPRSDATVMCQCLITSDSAFFEKMDKQEQIHYFKKSLHFIQDRYGEKNLVSATIHYDEKTPHLHINFVPVTADGRLSAKDLFSPQSLRILQDDYNRFVREQGYDLQRGEMDSQTKHLEVEKYKITTQYEQMKAKKQELERLKQIDTTVDFTAEKGKLSYSAKEVDAIQDQNKALKLKVYQKDKQIKDLKKDLAKASKTLLQAQNDLQATIPSLEQLKCLEIEMTALQEFRKENPDLDKQLESFDQRKEQAYLFGNQLAEYKIQYLSTLDERETLINHSNFYQKKIQDCDHKVTDLKRLKNELSVSITTETALRIELESLKGIFKKKLREDCQQRLEQQEKQSMQLVKRLQADHNTKPESIPQRLQDYANQKQHYLTEKVNIMEQTNQVEQISRKAVYSYKWYQALSDCQLPSFRELSTYLHAKVKLRLGEEKMFRLSQADRQQLLKDFEGNVNPQTIERCKENFNQQDIQERQAREQAQRTRSKTIPSR